MKLWTKFCNWLKTWPFVQKALDVMTTIDFLLAFSAAVVGYLLAAVIAGRLTPLLLSSPVTLTFMLKLMLSVPLALIIARVALWWLYESKPTAISRWLVRVLRVKR